MAHNCSSTMTRNPRPHDTTIRTIICYSAMASCQSIDLIDIDLID